MESIPENQENRLSNILSNENASPAKAILHSYLKDTQKYLENPQPVTSDEKESEQSGYSHALGRKLRFDVSSPSAILRERNPFKKFNYEEEFEDDIEIPPRLPENEILKGLHMFADVRDKEDNRSYGIKLILKRLGATVHDKLEKPVTHVIFREGLLSTYRKAKKMGCYLLSMFWLEAVRVGGRRVDETGYPSLDLEAYESPLASKNIRRYKSMQPDYENKLMEKNRKKIQRLYRKQAASGTDSDASPVFKKRRLSEVLTPKERASSGRRKTMGISTAHEASTSSDTSEILPHQKPKTWDIFKKAPQRNIVIQKTPTSCQDLMSPSQDPLPKQEVYKTPKRNIVINNTPSPSKIVDMIAGSQFTPKKSPRSKLLIQNTLKNRNIVVNTTPDRTVDLITDSQSETGSEFSTKVHKDDNPVAGIDLKNVFNALAEDWNGSLRACLLKGLGITQKENESSDGDVSSISDFSVKRKRSSLTVQALKKHKESYVQDYVTSQRENLPPICKSPYVTVRNQIETEELFPVSEDFEDVANSPHITVRNRIAINSPYVTVRNPVAKCITPQQISMDSTHFSPQPLAVFPETSADCGQEARSDSFLKAALDIEQEGPQKSARFYPPKQKSDSIVQDALQPKMGVLIPEAASDTPQNTSPINETSELKMSFHPEKVNVSTPKNDETVSLNSKTSSLRRSVRTTFSRYSIANLENIQKTPENTRKSIARKIIVTPNTPKSDRKVEKSPKMVSKTPKNISNDLKLTSKTSCNLEEKDARIATSSRKVASNLPKITPDPKIRTRTRKRASSVANIENDPESNRNSKILEEGSETPSVRRSSRRVTLTYKKQSKNRLPKITESGKSKAYSSASSMSSESPIKEPPSVRKVRKTKLFTQTNDVVEFDFQLRDDLEIENPYLIAKSPPPKIPPSRRRSTHLFTDLKPKKSQKTQRSKAGTIVCTRLHHDDIRTFEQIVRNLGGFEIEQNVSPRTTHLVAGEPHRTLNMLNGIIRGCWIVKYEWVLQSLEAGKWLDEEFFELTEFSPAVHKSRIDRQTFGEPYKFDLFNDCGGIYIAPNTLPKQNDLQSLVKNAGGVVVASPRQARIIVGQIYRNGTRTDDKIVCVNEKWILESITLKKIKSFRKFILTAS